MTTPEGRQLVLFNMMTLDGYFAGPNAVIDWHQADEEPLNLGLINARTFRNGIILLRYQRA